MAKMMAQGWGYYCASDHDTGVDNGDSDTTWMPYNILARQEVFPVPTDDAESPAHGLWHTWVAGRVRFILIDIRNIDRSPGANTDNSSKTMLGATQLAWLKAQLIQPEPLKVVIGDTAWMGNYLASDLDKWWSYNTERQAIISYVQANQALVKNMMWWHGDSHCLGVCPGASNSWGGWPVYCAAPLKMTGAADPNASVTFTSYYDAGGGDCRQYARIAMSDTGSLITVNFQGWDTLNRAIQVQQVDTFATATAGLATVTLSWDLTDLIEAGQQATLTIEPTEQLTDTTDKIIIGEVPRAVEFAGGRGSLAGIIATDDANILPAGFEYTIAVTLATGAVVVPPFTTPLAYASGAGATQDLSALIA